MYGDLDQYCDTASIMTYGMAWAGSAPGPVSPRSWLEGVYDYAVQVMNPDKVFLGMPAYGWNWQIYDTPENLGKYYRGTSHTYYAAKYWMQGVYNFTDDAPPQPFIPIVSYWDDYDMGPWALPHVYDYMEGRDATAKSSPQMAEVYNRRNYLTAYSKQQKTEFGEIVIDHNAEPDSYGGVVSVSKTLVTLGEGGSATYKFTIEEDGVYDVAIRLCYPFWDKNGIYASLDGSTVHFSEDRLWWPYWRTTFWATLAKGANLTAGEHTLKVSVDVNGVQFYGFRVCTDFSEEPSAGDGQDPADAGARDRLAAGQGGHLRSGPGPCGHARGQDGSALPERGAQAAHLPRGDPRGGGGERGRQGGSGHVCHPDGGAHRPHVHPGAEALVPPYHCGDRRALLSPDPGAAGHGGGKSGDRP